jgi:putative transposase
MIDRKHELSITKQAYLMGISRGTIYYLPKPVSSEDLSLMRRIDELHLEFPFAGSRMLRDLLNREREKNISRKRLRRLMKQMGIEALYRKPNTSKASKNHKIYPYLLRNRVIDRPNQVWAMDITYIPMAKGFVYLCAVVDWVSRKILSHRVSISMDTNFCLDALEEAFASYGQPDIFNTDQGSQFTSTDFTGALSEKGIQISMDGKGCWRDNVFVERVWRSIKYEEVYLHAYDSVRDAKQGISRYIDLYNQRRPHSKLGKQTPDEYYFGQLAAPQQAA